MMCYKSLMFYFAIICAVQISNANKLPDYFKTCRRSSPEYKSCFINSLNSLKPYMTRNMTELKIQSLDPFQMDQLEFGPDGGFISIEYAIFKNIYATGGSVFTVKNISVDFDVPKLDISIEFPQINVRCDYNISASSFFVPVTSDGLFVGNFSNVTSDTTIYGDYYTLTEDSAPKYVKINRSEIALTIENNSAELTDSGNVLKNSVINEFWPLIFAAIKPKLEEKLSVVVAMILRDFLETYSAEDFAPL